MTYNKIKDKSLDKFSHSLGQNWYHIVLIPKKRYAIFQWPQIKRVQMRLLNLFVKNHNIKILH